MKLLPRLALGLMAAPLFASAAMAELVTNGGFEDGNGGTPVTSGYTHIMTVAQTTCGDPAVYAIGANPNDCHSSWVSYGPHSGDNQMIVNGGEDASVALYTSNTMTVAPGGLYHLSIWGASSYSASPASLGIDINGTQVGVLSLTSTAGEWVEFAFDWDSVLASDAVISIFDLDTDYNGNDFTLDDISFNAVNAPVPEPMTLALMGAGLAGLGLRRRRRA